MCLLVLPVIKYLTNTVNSAIITEVIVAVVGNGEAVDVGRCSEVDSPP